MNAFDQMRQAMSEAREAYRAADHFSTQMADTLRGRLRKVTSPSALAALKRELKDFNAHTGKWKD